MIHEFVDHGLMPKKQKHRIWIFDHYLINEGYSKADIEMMESEEYEFLLNLIAELKMKGKTKNTELGI